MRQGFWIACLMMGLAAQAWAEPSTTPSGTTKVNLKLEPLCFGSSVMVSTTGSEAKEEAKKKDPGQRIVPSFLGGIFLPSTSITFTSSQRTTDVTIGGEKLTLGWTAGTRFALLNGKREQALKPLPPTINRRPNLTPLASAEFSLDKKRSYVLAFPMAEASKTDATLWYCSGGVQQAKVGSQYIGFYDSNLDGRYTISGDSFRIGRSDLQAVVFAPLSKYFSTKQGVYEIVSLAEDGSGLEYRKCPEQPVKLTVSFGSEAGEVQTTLLSETAGLNLVTVANSKSADELLVLPGVYKIGQGLVYAPRLGRVVATFSNEISPIEVTAGKAQKLELGAPFSLDFIVDRKGDNKISINPDAFRVIGKAGEVYKHIKWNKNILPEIYAISGKNQMKIGKMEFG